MIICVNSLSYVIRSLWLLHIFVDMYILYFLHLQKMCETVTIYESIILVQPYIISVQWKAFSISDIIYVGPINAV